MPHTDLEVQLASNAAAEENLVTRVLAEGIEYIYYQFVTLNGRVMAKVVPARHIQRNLQKGVQFHGSAIADLATFATLPWDPTFARMFCNLYRRRDAARDAGTTLPTCVRGNLMRVHRAFRDRTGYELRSGTEPEMSWFGDDIEVWSQPNVSPAYHFGALETMRPIVKRVMSYASALGLDMIEGDYEDTSQLELNFQFDRCDHTADRLVTYRQVCAQVAKEFGVIASFMPKPAVGAMANGCHHNLSLWRDGENAFEDPRNPQLHVTETARHALGGILAHSPGMLAVMAPTVNSYARYWDVGQFAPSIVNWGLDNRTCAVRVSASGRLEYKLPDASVNPYLSHALLLEAMADGLSAGIDPGAPQGGDSYDDEVVAADEASRGFGSLPRTLGDALAVMAADPVVRRALPEALYDAFMEYKTDEWERFCGTVTEWHRDMYLKALP